MTDGMEFIVGGTKSTEDLFNGLEYYGYKKSDVLMYRETTIEELQKLKMIE